ncbi:hypothetical protein HDU98_002140 [Podochytrium sp. JEL0797]|nr:hypothetical protein HDU98_002140 [Podochytrium sp. JEL0797]
MSEFQFYEGSLTPSAYVVPKSALSPVKTASSQATLSREQEDDEEIHHDRHHSNLEEYNPYDSDFEEIAGSPLPPPKRASSPPTPPQQLVKSPQPPQQQLVKSPQPPPPRKSKLHTFHGRTHPFLLPENQHCDIDPHVPPGGVLTPGPTHLPPLLKTAQPPPLKKKPPQHHRIAKPVSSATSSRKQKPTATPVLPHQRKMESILREIHHPTPPSGVAGGGAHSKRYHVAKRASGEAVAGRPDTNQFAKLSAVIDALKAQMREREEEIKTLKIVTRRQSIALKNTDKTQQDLPNQLHQHLEELRVLKHTHATCSARIAQAEKSSQLHMQESMQWREKVAKMTAAGAVGGAQTRGEGGEKMQLELEMRRREGEEKDAAIADLTKKLKFLENNNNMAIREVRLKNTKLTKELEEVKANSKILVEKLEEKTRQISAMSIYSLVHNIQNPHLPSTTSPLAARPVSKTPSHHKHHPVLETTIRIPHPPPNATKPHINPQSSLHKPTLQKPTATTAHTTKSSSSHNTNHTEKPNNDAMIRAWNLSQTPIPSIEFETIRATTLVSSPQSLTPAIISHRLSILDQSQDTPVATVARRYLLMLGEKGHQSPEPSAEGEMGVPPVATQKPKIVLAAVEEANKGDGDIDLEY